MNNFCSLHNNHFSTSIWARELWKKGLNIFFQLFSEIFRAFKVENQCGVENRSCPKFNFTSPKVLKIFFSGQIFSVMKRLRWLHIWRDFNVVTCYDRLFCNLIIVYPQLFEYIHNSASISTSLLVYPQLFQTDIGTF